MQGRAESGVSVRRGRRGEERWKQDQVRNRTGRDRLQRAPHKQGRRAGGGWRCRPGRASRREGRDGQTPQHGADDAAAYASRAHACADTTHEVGALAPMRAGSRTCTNRIGKGIRLVFGSDFRHLHLGGATRLTWSPDHARLRLRHRGGRRLAAAGRPRRRHRSTSAVGPAGGQVMRAPRRPSHPCAALRLPAAP